jgi:hypothetical protein
VSYILKYRALTQVSKYNNSGRFYTGLGHMTARGEKFEKFSKNN